MLLTSRKLLQRKLLDVESDLRGTLCNFGLKVGVASTGKFEARIRELVAGSPRLALIVEPLLAVRRVMRQQFAVLHKSFVVTAMWPAGWVVPAKRQTSPADALELHNCTKTSASNTLATENLPRHSPWGFIINANCSSQQQLCASGGPAPLEARERLLLVRARPQPARDRLLGARRVVAGWRCKAVAAGGGDRCQRPAGVQAVPGASGVMPAMRQEHCLPCPSPS